MIITSSCAARQATMKISAFLVTIHKQNVFFLVTFQNKYNLALLCNPLVILKPLQPVWKK